MPFSYQAADDVTTPAEALLPDVLDMIEIDGIGKDGAVRRNARDASRRGSFTS
jgi:hypothetical protein